MKWNHYTIRLCYFKTLNAHLSYFAIKWYFHRTTNFLSRWIFKHIYVKKKIWFVCHTGHCFKIDSIKLLKFEKQPHLYWNLLPPRWDCVSKIKPLVCSWESIVFNRNLLLCQQITAIKLNTLQFCSTKIQ